MRIKGRLIMASVLAVGFWQLGQGAYLPAKAWVAQELLQKSWRKTQRGEAQVTPWPWADTYPVARLSARDGDVDLVVLAGGNGRTMAFGPGHLSGSAMAGEVGNMVIAGHRDTHFSFLRDLKTGDELLLQSDDRAVHRYRVTGTEVVDAGRATINLDADSPRLTLLTCYPFDAMTSGGPLRYVVNAEYVRKPVAF